MATDSVKFLNTECLLRVNVAVSKHQLEEAAYAEHIREEVHHRLSRMMGELAMAEKATVNEQDRPGRHERVFQAEAYVLSIADAKKLYHMIREEVRKELS